MKYKTQEYSNAKNAKTYDYGLRQYMLRVYNYMAAGLTITGLFAVLVASNQVFLSMIYSPTGGITALGLLVAFAPLAFSLAIGLRFEKMSAFTLQTIFFLYSTCIGLSLSYLFVLYTGASIARVFFMSASVFAGMSLYGYTTQKDLTSFGSFLLMGLMGLLVTSIINMFIGSSALHFISSFVGLFIFIGLVAFHTQDIKNTYFQVSSNQITMHKGSIMAALTLYLDFISIFLRLLQFFGERKE